MNERSIFMEALGLDDPREQDAYLLQACGGDLELWERVEALLRSHRGARPFILDEVPAVDLGATVEVPRRLEGPGTVIGPYTLREQIGEGGMGVVYVAEQTVPVRRKVALKVIKPGMDSKQVVARFEAERQALALMDHPNIARVFDAGTTEAGRPYFVMELVKGITITDYCDRAQLSPRERLELFIPVCQAVQHAHQKGIIHRDLKPSNVLVTLHDGTPMVKVIDFGVAKAIGQHLTEKTIYTQFAQLIGTPLYMSPEQAEMSGLDVDTRSDIYALGVLLYELLTGSTPFDRQRFGRAAFDEIRRIIREEEPPRPSTRLTSLGQELPTVSAKRSMEPGKLSALVRGDLDWIVMKALEKDRTRRYETASAFATDVRRFLAEEPVEARPPSAWYRFGKLARRNRAALTTAALVAGALVLGTAVATWQAVQATREASRATRAEARTFAELREKERARAEAVAARKRAEEFADRLREATALVARAEVLTREGRWSAAHAAFARAEGMQPSLLGIYTGRGDLYTRLGLWDLAAAESAKAVALTGRMGGYSADWYRHALLRFYVGDEEGYEEACRRMFHRFGSDSEEKAVIDAIRACALSPRPPVEPAELVRRAQQSNAWGEAPWDLYVEGLVRFRAGQHEKAVELFRKSLDATPRWSSGFINHLPLAMAYHRLGRSDEARRSLAAADSVFAAGIWVVSEMPLGLTPFSWSDRLEAELLHREATMLLTGSPPSEDRRLGALRERSLAALSGKGAARFPDLVRDLMRRGDRAAAAAEIARVLDLSKDSLWHHTSISQACLEAARRPEVFAELVRLRPDHPQIWVAHGRSQARRKEWGQALADYARVMDSRPPDDNALLEYASLRLLAGDQAGYKRLCARLVERHGETSLPGIAYELSRVCTLAPGAVDDPARLVAWSELGATRKPLLPWDLHTVGAACYRAGRFDEAIRHFQESQRLAPTWPGQCLNDIFLALSHARLGQRAEARRSLEKTDRWLADADRQLAETTIGFPPLVFPADWLIVQVLRREADRVLAGPPAGGEIP